MSENSEATIEHKWVYCETCMVPMVVCGKCGNNCCNGGSGIWKPCPDQCESAYEMQRTQPPPPEMKARSEQERATWLGMTPEERAELQRNDSLFLEPPLQG